MQFPNAERRKSPNEWKHLFDNFEEGVFRNRKEFSGIARSFRNRKEILLYISHVPQSNGQLKNQRKEQLNVPINGDKRFIKQRIISLMLKMWRKDIIEIRKILDIRSRANLLE